MLCAGFVRPGHYHAWYTEVTGINFDWELEDKSSEEDGSDSNESESGSEPDENGTNSDETDDENNSIDVGNSEEEEANLFKQFIRRCM